MNFDLDDPLADILSGGSDDSFFDDDVMGKRKTPTKSTPLSEKKKSSLFDLDDDPKSASNPIIDKKKSNLFNLDDDPTPTTQFIDESKKDIEQDLITKPASLKTSFSKDSITAKDPLKTPIKTKDTILELGQTSSKEKIASLERFDSFERMVTPKGDLFSKQSEKRKSANSLLDDILGGPNPQKTSSTQIKPPKSSKSQEFDFEALLGNTPAVEPKKTIAPHTAPSKISKSESKPERSSKSGTSIPKTTKSKDDWLGIFKENDDTDKDVTQDSGMPAWLVGKDDKTKNTNLKRKDSVKTPEPVRKVNVKDLTSNDDDNKEQTQSDAVFREMKSIENTLPKNEPVITAAMPTILSASNDDITQEGAALYMQQQESQLMVALQLKAQEEKLAAMQMRQQESKKIQQQATEAHHSQLNAMLEKQAAHRQQMQTIIMSHQERINERIKSLLGTSNINNDAEDNIGDFDNPRPTGERKESPHMKEKKQLLQLVQTLQENHDKEIDLMETSYRRQLAFTDASLNQSEERMKEETDKLIKHYTEKIEWLEEQQRSHRHLVEENVKSMSEQHAQELRDVRASHLESVRVLQEQHAALMHNIKNSVQQERVLIQDSATFSTNLTELLADVKESRSHCQQLVEDVRSMHEKTSQESGNSLKMREAQVNEMLQHLTNERESFEKEKSESRDMVKLLETRLKQMSQSVEDEIGALKQKRMEFEFEKATFSKQTEFAKNILKKQEEEIKMIKEDVQKEYEDKIAKIEEERSKGQKDAAIIAKERITTQNLRQELEKLKAELQSQMEQVSEDRSRISLEKHQMHMEEQRILAKSRDLDLLSKSALEKQSQADKKLSEAEYVQRKFEDRIRRLQEHIISLNSREKMIAREKVALSRERLGLHNERRHLESRQQCSLCRSINQTQHSYGNAFTTQHEPLMNLNMEYLSMGVSRDYGVASDANALEREMSNLLGQDNLLDRGDSGNKEGGQYVLEPLNKGMVDPKLLLLRLDVQQVINNLNENSDVKPKEDK